MSFRTPAQIQEFLDNYSHRMDGPQQFIGDEPNSYRKPWASASARWLIAASWAYEAAAGNSSVPAVYKAVNIAADAFGRDSFLCDRFYLPATPRDLRLIESNGIPIFGIESKHQARDFDVFATSISYPILVMSFVKMLKVADIPVRWADRVPEDHPMIIIGGQIYGAPEILAPIADAVWCGEVESEPGNPGIEAVTERIAQFKDSGMWSGDRVECYRRMAREFNFLYFPRFIDVTYAYEDRTHVGVPLPSKQVVSYTGNLEGMRLPITKRIVKDFDARVPLDNPPLLYTDPGMGAGDIEVGRGCPAWCSFCALTYRQKPYRQSSVGFLTDYAKQMHINSGSTGITPFSPDFPMYAQKKRLIRSLLENVSDEVDAGAMRVDDFIADKDFILLQVQGGLDSVTLGVEGNSQRMRDFVGKGTSDEDIIEAFTRGMRAGIRKFKFFMISNLPGEDEGDIFRILGLAKRMADIREGMNQPNIRIMFSWTPLFIEGNTPFQWFAPQVANRIIGDVWEELRSLRIEFKLGTKNEPNKATFVQLAQRASRDIGEALVDAMDTVNVACWGGVPTKNPGLQALVEQALHAHGFDNGFDDAFDERFKDDMFGWEFIDQGVSPELLWVTYQQMVEFIENTDSHTYDENFDDQYHGSEWIERCDTACQGKTCGVCDPADFRKRRQYITESRSEATLDLTNVTSVDEQSQAFKVRARLDKAVRYRLVMNDHWRFNLRRAAYKAFEKLAYYDESWNDVTITKRSIRFASDDIKYREWSYGADYVEFGLTRRLTVGKTQRLIDTMNDFLCATAGDEDSRWMRIESWQMVPTNTVHMRAGVDLTYWSVPLDYDLGHALRVVQEFKDSPEVMMVLHAEPGNYAVTRFEVNAKDHVEDIWLARVDGELYLRFLMRGKPSPYELLSTLFGRSALEAARKPAKRIDSFIDLDADQADFLRPDCESCGKLVPINLLDAPYDLRYCPRCQDIASGASIEVIGTPG